MDGTLHSSRPRLVLRFAAASLVAFLVIGAVVSQAMVNSVRRRAEDHAEFHARYMVDSVLAPAVGGIDLTRPVAGHDLAVINELVHDRILSDGRTVRVKIWSPGATVLYSDDRSLIGRTFPDERAGFAEVMEGHIENEISDLNAAENIRERPLADKLFQTYVPLRPSPGARPVAIAEVYQDYSAIQAEIDVLVRTLAVTFAVGLAVLYALLLPIAFGASRMLRRRNERLREQAERLEEHLSREQETVAELRHLNQMQTDFVAAASHELRTPLTGIIGYLRTLRRSEALDDPSAAAEFLAAAERQATRLAFLVQNILSTAHLEDSSHPAEISEFLFDELMARVLSDLPAGAERVRIHTEGSPTVRTDREQLHEVLLNLVENAVKCSPGNEPIDVDADVTNGELVVRVRDHGVGIDPADQPAIFERFHQLDQSATRQFGGLGLGLHLSRKLVEGLGGSISVDSTVGEGSMFTVRIPLARSSVADALARGMSSV